MFGTRAKIYSLLGGSWTGTDKPFCEVQYIQGISLALMGSFHFTAAVLQEDAL